MSVVIQVENVSKSYRLGAIGGGTLGAEVARWLAKLQGKPDPNLRIGQEHKAHLIGQEFWALQEASFEIKEGEILGVVGRNGAGKSTLLKILSRVTAPTKGEVRVKGRIASLLEVGTGFHPELTGRENIFLNGAILGMSKAEIRRKLDEIVAFSEVQQFIDTPVKRYSSGMYVRLAFAVAAHLEPEILLIDEVLAVGDLSFQKKCLWKMGEVARGGRTVLFVSHNLEAVRTLCKRAILFDEGKIRADGEVENVVESYFALNSLGSGRRLRGARGLAIEKVALKNDGGEETPQFCPGEDLIVEITFDAQQRIETPYFILVIQGKKGNCFTANMLLDGHRPKFLEGKGIIACRFKSIPLLPQRYTVKMGITASNGKDLIMDSEELGSFNVTADLEDYGYKGEFQTRASESTSVVIAYEWQLPDGSTAKVSLSDPRRRGSEYV